MSDEVIEMSTEAPGDLLDQRLESLPDEVVSSMELRDAWLASVAATGQGLEFLVSGLRAWTPGSTVLVAFLGGDSELHGKIADAAAPISAACNLTLDFGRTDTGTFRTWSESDTTYTADIRVSFDQGGFFSLLGTDSTDRFIGAGGGPVGGGPGQRSLNLGGFTSALPTRWKGTVRHEFLHALAFNHEHQNLRGPCQDDFRWENDLGYVPTTDARGVFVADSAGRRPGIYTYLAGPPNRWPRAKVDHNLRPPTNPDLISSEFDRASVMLYRFDALFYRTSPSPCAPTGNGEELSAGDQAGLKMLYPVDPDAVSDSATRAKDVLVRIAGQESGGTSSPFQDRVVQLLESRAGITS
jgi:hypothetical protein